LLAFSNVTNESAQVVWRFRGIDGKELRGQQVVREQNGAQPKELVIEQAFFSAGPYKVRWSPAEVTMTGTRDKPQSVVSATSRVFYAPELRAANVAKSFEREDLAAACR
jgi:methyl coenzyme M reductase gamma subunit